MVAKKRVSKKVIDETMVNVPIEDSPMVQINPGEGAVERTVDNTVECHNCDGKGTTNGGYKICDLCMGMCRVAI